MPKVGALALVKAHPLIFGAFVAVAIGVVVYNIVQSKKQKKHAHKERGGGNGSNGGGGGGGNGPSGPSDFYFYDATTKSVTDSATPVQPKAPGNNLRRRSTAQNSSSTVSNDNSESEKKKENKSSVSREVQTDSVDYNQNDIDKVLTDKDLNIPMSMDERLNNFLRNIPPIDSPDDNDDSHSQGSINKPVRNCFCDCDSHSEGSCYSSSSSSSWSNISLSDGDKIRKKKKSRKSRASSVCSIESETSVGTVLSGDSEVCRGCEEKSVNTHAQPCNHRYLCSDCAMRFFRLYKKCKVCRARIERIVFED